MREKVIFIWFCDTEEPIICTIDDLLRYRDRRVKKIIIRSDGLIENK